MMIAEHPMPPQGSDPVSVIARHLRDGDDVVRCAASRALGRLADPAAAPALVEALLDEDPDVRNDAMEALVACARPEDADAIRRSLMGDPVKEVKAAAIDALCRLNDRASLPLLRALAKDRCAHDVAWEDEAGMWDDWLDVQLAAIAALGEMGAAEAIDDLLLARSDEMGQELDDVVFDALARIPDGGIETLLGLLRDRSERVRARALQALAKARRELLLPLRELLLRDSSADVRRLALLCLDPADPAVDDLVLRDPDPVLRRDALGAFAEQRSDLAKAALRDEDEAVRACAIDWLAPHLDGPTAEDLAANLQVWQETAGPTLAAACLKALPALIGSRAEPLLCAVAVDSARTLEARVAALRALASCREVDSIEALRQCAIDRMRQVRLVAIASLADLSKGGEGDLQSIARDALVAALRGDLLATNPAPAGDLSSSDDELGASKVEGGAGGRITISRDGEILSPAADGPQDDGEALPGDNVIQGVFPRSTLDAIQSSATLTREETDPEPDDERRDPSEAPRKGKRRRVAVDGPDDVAGDIPLIALRVAADCPGAEVDAALRDAFLSADQRRPVAAEAIARRSEVLALSSALLSHVTAALEDEDPVVRGHAAAAVLRSASDAADRLRPLLDDPDAVIRALALRAVSTAEAARAGLADSSLLVRRAALDILLKDAEETELNRGLATALSGGWSDSLADACGRSAAARRHLLGVLGAEAVERRAALVALEALAQASSPRPGEDRLA